MRRHSRQPLLSSAAQLCFAGPVGVTTEARQGCKQSALATPPCLRGVPCQDQPVATSIIVWQRLGDIAEPFELCAAQGVSGHAAAHVKAFA